MDWKFFEEGDLDWILNVTKDMFEESEWNDGEYDKDTYERERNELLTQLQSDEASKQYEQVSEMRREIFDLDKDDEIAQDEFYEQEANDISQLNEDYMDGTFYPEDVDDYDM